MRENKLTKLTTKIHTIWSPILQWEFLQFDGVTPTLYKERSPFAYPKHYLIKPKGSTTTFVNAHKATHLGTHSQLKSYNKPHTKLQVYKVDTNSTIKITLKSLYKVLAKSP